MPDEGETLQVRERMVPTDRESGKEPIWTWG